MNNPINPFGAWLVYEQLEFQMGFRHGGPPLVCPTNRLPSWQLRIPFYDAAPRLTLISVDGKTTYNISARGVDVHDPEDGETFIYTFRGAEVSTPFPCGIFYMFIRIDTATYYTERIEIKPLPNGGRVDVALVATTDLTFTATEINTAAADSYHWEYYIEGLGWEDMVVDQSQNEITVDASLFWQASPQDMLVPIRRRLLYNGFEVEAYFTLMLRQSVINSELLRVPPPNDLTQTSDYYMLEFWHDSDEFDYLYTRGMKQRLYVLATYDGMTGDENDSLDVKPTGESELRSSVFKPRAQLSIASLPDVAYPALEGLCRHDNIRVVNLKNGVQLMAKECQFEPGQGEDPLSITGTLSFVTDILYRPGARTYLQVTTNDPIRDDNGGLDGD